MIMEVIDGICSYGFMSSCGFDGKAIFEDLQKALEEVRE